MSDNLTPEQTAAAEAEAEAEASKEMIDIVTTAPGVFGIEGIAKVGTKRSVHYTAVSDKWMKPATIGDASKLKKLRKGAGQNDA